MDVTDRPVTIRLAMAADSAVVSEILEEARRWIAAHGIAQWTLPFSEEWLAPKIAAGQVYLVERDGRAIATFRLLWADPIIWGEWEDGSAAYIHSLAVRRDAAGVGLGARILDWVANEAAARDRASLRLDCLASNAGLLAYYDGLGFSRVGAAEAGGDLLVLYERPIGVRSQG